MPKLKVETQTKLSANDAFNKIRHLLENDKDLRKMDSSYVCQFNESGLTGTAKGSKFDAEMKVKNTSSGSVVEIEVSLPLILTPVKGVVQSTLQKKLDRALT